MRSSDKTPEQVMREYENGIVYVDNQEKYPDFHTMALLAAKTIPSSSIQELLSNAEKIETWLNRPRIEKMSREEKFTKAFMREWEINVDKKSPAENSDRACDDLDVFP